MVEPQEESTNAAPSSSATVEARPADRKPYACQQCEKSFGRLTHLRRHEQSNHGDSAHVCDVCQKTFARLDSLKRHKLTHDDPQRQAGNKVPKACAQCVNAKTKCTGEQPCRRCESRSLTCVYIHAASVFHETLAKMRGSEDTEEPASPEPVFVGHYAWVVPPSQQQTPAMSYPPDVEPTTAITGVSPDNDSQGQQKKSNTMPDGYNTSSPAYSTDSPGPEEKYVGRYYADEQNRYLPHIRKYNVFVDMAIPVPQDIDLTEGYPFYFPEVTLPDQSTQWVSEKAYSTMRRAFVDSCGSNPRFPFDLSNFVSHVHINILVGLYASRFHTLLPIIHLATLDLEQSHWTLTLAMAAVGAHFTQHPRSRDLCLALLEGLRRSLEKLRWSNDLADSTPQEQLDLTRVRLLGAIGMIHSGNMQFVRHARTFALRELTSFCSPLWAEACREASCDSEIVDWHAWIYQETSLRTGLAVWLLDSIIAYTYSYPADLSLESVPVSLPCQEVLFDANSSMSWAEIMSHTPAPASMAEELERLYIQKKVSSNMSDFARFLLIHALYHRTWDVERYVRQPLSHHAPKAGYGSSEKPRLVRTPYLPDIPLFSGWRNAACDGLDVLYRTLSGNIGASPSADSPLMSALHLGYSVLLSPTTSIRELACHMAPAHDGMNLPYPFGPAYEHAARLNILAWINRDAYKARLGLVHAGILFWHVERSPAVAFWEPIAVYLATLTLWAYAVFHSHPARGLQGPSALTGSSIQQQTSSLHANTAVSTGDDALPMVPADVEYDSGSESSTELPSPINLDRPMDQELLQSFVKHGALMQAHMSGVGDIRAPGASAKIAARGARTLRNLSSWGISWPYIRVLEGLQREVAEKSC